MKSNRKRNGKEKVTETETNEETIALTSLESVPIITHDQPPESSRQTSEQDGLHLSSQLTSHVSDQRVTDGDNDRRLFVEIDEKGNFCPSKAVSEIVKVYETMFAGASGTWCTTSSSLRDAWFTEFKKKVRWPEGQDELVRKVFNKRGAKRFADTLNEVKKKKQKPSWMHATDYENMKRYWNSERHKKYSAANKKNRLGKDGSGPKLHTAGARPFHMVARMMEKELGRPPTVRELVTRTHTHADSHKKAGKPVDKKSEMIMRDLSERVVAARAAAATEENVFPTDGTSNIPAPPAVDEFSIYLEVTGGRRKGGSVYGLGSLSGEPSSSYSSCLSHKTKHDEEMAENMKQVQKENLGLREDVKRLEKQLGKLMKHLHMQLDGEESEDLDEDNASSDGSG